MSSDDERDDKELDLTSPEVVTKYKSAAEIVNSNALSLSFSHFLSISLYGSVYLLILGLELQRRCRLFWLNASQELRLSISARKETPLS